MGANVSALEPDEQVDAVKAIIEAFLHFEMRLKTWRVRKHRWVLCSRWLLLFVWRGDVLTTCTAVNNTTLTYLPFVLCDESSLRVSIYVVFCWVGW